MQEVVNEEICLVSTYDYFVNIGSNGRGTAILYKNGIPLHSMTMIPDGRGISCLFEDTLIVNLYAPSGTNDRQARQQFYSNVVLILFEKFQSKLILGSDFNAVLKQEDCTGNLIKCLALNYLVRTVEEQKLMH